MRIDEKLLDEMAQMEVSALLDGLKDEELRANPAFLARVRQFMKENKLQTTPETEGMKELKKQVTTDIPVFDDIVEGGSNVIAMGRKAN